MAGQTPGDWRHDAGAGGKSLRSWHPRRPAAPGGRGRSRVIRVLVAGAAVGGLLALVVILIEWLKPPRYARPVVSAPDDGAGRGSAVAVAEAAGVAPLGAADRDGWRKGLDPRAPSVMVVFAQPGGADPDGPFLWDDGRKLRVREVLAELAKLPEGQPKLLVFDATHNPASWPRGMLFNDFARALKELDAEIARVGGLAVICASDEDQRSWASDEWRRTVFGHFYAEGLRGAGGNPGDRVTADRLFHFLAREVDRWAVANRNEHQTPILLPRGDGVRRAARVELVAAPRHGYATPPAPKPPGPVPADLAAAWEAAEELARRASPPDATDPAAWREYLDLLQRWERLVRSGGDPGAVRGRVRVLEGRLRAAGVEPACLPAADPVGRAFGVPPRALDPHDLRRLWDAPPADRDRVWRALLGRERVGEAALRLAVARSVVARVVADGPTPGVLRTADEVLAVAFGTRLVPAEAHFVRMLHLRLDPAARPPVEVLRTAVRLRVEAEEVAWAGGVGPGKYPYAEQVFRWARGHVEAGDAARERGQDLLFATAAESWQAAEGTSFLQAQAHYRAARDVARVVAAALATRDRVLTRVPYYARWVAGHRGSPEDVEKLLAAVEESAGGAHRIADLTRDVPADLAARMAELAAATEGARRAFDDVVRAFEAEVRGLSNVVHPSNWHALDAVLAVPFLPARDRVKLLGYVRDVSYQLATKSEQRPGVAAPPPSARELAKRQGRMAVAVLGERSAELHRRIESPEPGAWWAAYREAGERIGGRFRGLAAEAGAAPDRAADLARLADPAAPVPGDPVGAELRGGRHDLLLWQAERAVRAGWADVGGEPGGYAVKSRTLLVASAKDLVRDPDPHRPPDAIDPRLDRARAAERLTPTTLEVRAPAARELADEWEWELPYSFGPGGAGRVDGFPVHGVTPHGPSHAAPTPAVAGRRADFGLAAGEKEVSHRATFRAPPAARDVTEPGRLGTTVHYRGYLYEATTVLRPAGPPTRDYRIVPPTGPAGVAVQADRELVAGAVTVLIDLSGSMREVVPGTKRTKLQATFDALAAMLDNLPRNTVLTVAFFWRDDTRPDGRPDQVERVATKLRWRGEAVQKEEVMKAVRAQAPAEHWRTPLARSVRRVLSKEAGFWPEAASGTRTLVVLTDGADNVDGKEAGKVVLEALRGADDDTALHLIFFGMSEDEQRFADRQYRPLEDPAEHRPGRTPARLWRGARDAAGLAGPLWEAMLPQVSYRRGGAAGGPAGRLLVTAPEERLRRPSPALVPGPHSLKLLREWEPLHLHPGDRLMLRTGPDGKLYLPPVAFETALKQNLPRGTAGDAVRGGLHLTVPQAAVRERVGHCDLSLLMTAEPFGGSRTGPLQRPRPRLVWFEWWYADGEPPDRGLRPTLVVRNRPGLLAPAYEVTLSQVDRTHHPGTARPPAVTAHWVDNLPDPVAKLVVDLANPDQTPELPAGVKEVRVTVEDVTGGDLPPGRYVTVRLRYGATADRVVLLPGQPDGFAERHLYFDGQGRYTARFGPVAPPGRENLSGSVRLELYRVEELKKLAADRGRAATAALPDRRVGPARLPDELRLDPAKE